MKRRIGLAAAVIMFLFLFAGCASSTDQSVTVGNDTVASLYSVVGERRVTGTSKGVENDVNYVTLTYDNGDVTENDIYNYYQKLQSDGFILVEDADTTKDPIILSLGKESSEAGKIILVDISYSQNGTTEISYKTKVGTISRY